MSGLKLYPGSFKERKAWRVFRRKMRKEYKGKSLDFPVTYRFKADYTDWRGLVGKGKINNEGK